MKPQLLITCCLLWQTCFLEAQSLNYMPPSPGGFEVLATTKYLPPSYVIFSIDNKSLPFFPLKSTSSIQHDLSCHYAIGQSRWVLFTRIPLSHQIKYTFSSGVHAKVRGISNTEVAVRYQITKPELIGSKKYLLAEFKSIMPPYIAKDSTNTYPVGYEGFSFEHGVFGGLKERIIQMEFGGQLGLSTKYNDYITGYGKIGIQMKAWQLAGTMRGRLPIYWKSGENNFSEFNVMYGSRQSYLIGEYEINWNPSRFLGLSVSFGQVLLGDQILGYTALGAGIFVRWN